MAKQRTDEQGSIAILVALSITAILGLAALATDVGMLYVYRQRLSTVADAAALAGAQQLPANPAGALTAATGVLQKNGIDPATAQLSVSDDLHQLSVSLTRTVPMTFARIIGTSQMDVGGSATAKTTNVSGFYGAAPLGVPKADWQYGQLVYLKLDANTGTIAPGNYQALALGKSGASMYEDNLTNGYKDWIRADQWLDTETGNMAGPTVRALNTRINQDPNSTYLTANRQSPRLVVVPILEDYNVNGKGQVHVIGFGTFYLEQAKADSSSSATVVGRFVRFMTEGEGSLTAPDFGTYTTKLIQ